VIAAASELRATMQGEVILPDEEGYDNARQLFNGAVDTRPAVFAMCETQQDVQAAVCAARIHDLPLSVRGGGHDWAGRALRQNGLVINMSRMRRVSVDQFSRTATVAGGATARDVMSAAVSNGLAAVTGNCGTVCMSGLTLGGGYSAIGPRYGMAVDNLLSAELVLPNGEFVCADAVRNRELFWAIRGGGGNFGVVTSMRLQLHRLEGFLAGVIIFPWSEAESVFRGYANLVASAPDELAALAGFASGPDGSPTVIIFPLWCGKTGQGEKVIASLQQLGTPIFTQVARMSSLDMLSMFDQKIGSGQHYEVQTRSIAKLTPDAIAELIEAGSNRTSPYSMVVWHHMHGAPTRVPLSETAFGLRDEHFMVEILAAWEPAAEDSKDNGMKHRQWARTLSKKLAPHALPGGYPNMLGPDEHEQIAHSYGNNLARLRKAKKLFDPDGVFTSATTIPMS
jgi:FAD/FMN-containing dehydrogenase